jgi:hypothetical protein
LLPLFIRPNQQLIAAMINVSAPRYGGLVLDAIAQPLDHGLTGVLEKDGKAYVAPSTDEGVFLEFSTNTGYRNLLKGLETFKTPTPRGIIVRR